ncbi:rod-binding protein [Candidatus Laterigemmans baculatus]|uniref:rod-binding protein n=1 Tax=Candidatus Laterigemmans baculatus TaxID=2770505 RepID=UPI0013DD1E02|nr:rod-binding protein [Candidatus Laterigemmans baculatus]
MNILPNQTQRLTPPSTLGAPPSPAADPAREAFRDFVGQTLFGQMLSSMRSTVGTPAYFHGGRTEEIFQEQMDQILVEDITEKSADTIADPMYELFSLRRS